MVCLNKKSYEKELADYASVLGSESAAYYVLAMNNGYTLDLDPEGKPSQLYKDILIACGGNEVRALQEKALYYTQAYIQANGDWTENLTEPAYNPGLAVTHNTVALNILLNDVFGSINNSLLANGVDDREYAMRTAIERTRHDYLDQKLADFSEENRLKLKYKYNAKGFFLKVLAFIKSPFNFNKIKEPSSKEKQKSRREAFDEFNDTLNYLILNELNESIYDDVFKDWLREKRTVNSKNEIHGFLAFLDIAEKGYPIVLDNEIIVYRLLSMLKDFEYTEYDEGIGLFGNINNLAKALMSEDISSYTADQQDYLNDFISNIESSFISDLKTQLTPEVKDLVLMYFTQSPTTDINKAAYDVIKNGLESRLKSIQRSNRSSNKDVIYSIKTKIHSLKLKNTYDSNDMFFMYTDFLESAETEFRNAIKYLDRCILDPKKISSDAIMYLQTDVIGYYDYIIKNHINNLDKRSGLSSSQLSDIKDLHDRNVEQLLSQVIQKYNRVLELYCDRLVDNYVDENYVLGDIEAHKKALHAALRNQIDNGSIMLGEQFLGDATLSKSLIVRMIANLLNNDERKVERDANKVGHKLLGLYTKCEGILSKVGLDPRNYMKFFCEIGNDGKPTGYFVRGYEDENGRFVGINYGQFFKDKSLFEKKLQLEMGIPADEHGNPIWNFNIKDEELRYNRYMDELDDWLDDHCDRRYNKNYYKARRSILTREAREALSFIDELILMLLDKCTDRDGFVYTSMLSSAERSKLNSLRREREELGNPYAVTIDTTGKILKLEKKTGDALKIAESIIEWNQFSKDAIEREPDWDRYNEALAKITDPVERARFEADNTVTRISPEFYERLKNCTTANQTQEYLKLSAERNKIMGFTKDSKGYVNPDLLRLNDEAWAELKSLELQLQSMKTRGSKGSENFDDFAVMYPVTMDDPANPGNKISVLAYFEAQARAQLAVDPDALNKFYDKYYFRKTDSKGNVTLAPLSVFYVVGPKDQSYIETVPSNGYTKAVGGWAYNDLYDENNKEPLQPHASKYYNKRFSLIMKNKDTREFYEYILDIMQESIDKLPAGTNASIYKMPLVTDNSLSLLTRGKGFSAMAQHFTITENDSDLYREDLARRPDGSFVETVPMRYVTTLEDPSMISCDIVRSVTQFFAMAENFELKSKTVPVVEALISKMKGGINSSDTVNSEQATRAEKELEMYGYGRQLTGFGESHSKMSSGQKIATKGFNVFRSVSNVALLAGNVFSASKGFVSAYWQTGTEAFVGKYYDKGDRLWTTGRLLRELPNALRSIGQGNTHSLIMAAMQHNGIASSLDNSFGDKDKLWIRRILGHFKMGMFTMGDYITNSIILTSVYHATRLIADPVSGKMSFMTEEECIDMFVKNGGTEKQAIKYFEKHSDNHLLNMYQLGENGEFELKDKVTIKVNGVKLEIKPSDYVTSRVENRISGTCERRGSIANGVISKHGKGKIYQGTLTRLLVTMRGYLFSQGWDRLKRGNDFTTKYYDEGQLRIIHEDSMYSGQYDMETGHCEPGVYMSIFNAWKDMDIKARDFMLVLPIIYKHIKNHGKIKKADAQNLTRICCDLVGVATFLTMCSWIFIPKVREYPEEWGYQFLALVSLGCAIETSTPISPTTVLDLATTVTTTYSYFKDLTRISSYIKDLLGLSGHELDESVRSGGYKNKERWFRDMMKIFARPTGLTGYYESFTPAIPGIDDPEKSKYLKRQTESLDKLGKMPVQDYFTTQQGLGAISDVFTTPLGVQSKYDWYQGNAFPATFFAPKRKDPNAPSSSNSNSKKSHKRKTRKSRKSRKSKLE